MLLLALVACGVMALVACGGSSGLDLEQIRLYETALDIVHTDPNGTAAACASVSDPHLHADCVTAGVEALAGKEPDAARMLCGGLPEGLGRDECFFQAAERSAGVVPCAGAGRFADDCRMHLWSAHVMRLSRNAPPPGVIEASLEPALVTHDFSPDDDRPWLAAYRTVLGARHPLDLGSCAAAPDTRRQGICRRAGLQLYEDRLNHVRDTTGFPCGEGEALPALLQAVSDPDLDAVLARRRPRDLCP